MKKILPYCFLCCVSLLAAQYTDIPISDSVASLAFEDDATLEHRYTSFEEAARELNINQKTIASIEGVQKGYYVINGVFSKETRLQTEIKKLSSKGFDAGYFPYPKDNLFYLYLNRYNTWQESLQDCNTHFDNRYTKEIWVLHVATTSKNSVLENKEQNQPEDALQGKTSTQKARSSKSSFIKKANTYFHKMWYAEAAKLYELALEKEGATFDAETIQKAADTHYFNTDMKNAYKWYHLLYEKQGDDMSAENLFKYQHSLKGTEHYKRAKKLTRLYNKKKNTVNSTYKNQGKEAVLDGLLRKKEQFDITNLNINTVNSEFVSNYYATDKIVFASTKDSSIFKTRNYKWNNQPYLDLYVAKINEETLEFNEAVKFSKNINSKYHDASATFSPDHNTMYFTRNNYDKKLKRAKNGINNLKIYKSVKVGGTWSTAVEVPFNSDEYSTGHPTLSPDGKKLYFASDMPGTLGKTDLFVVDILEDGSFSSPKNLGPDINTEQNELFPFITNNTLYFSSNGHTGLGGLDIFEVSFTDDSGFLEVRNMGKPINSKNDDFSFITTQDKSKGYFSSNRLGGKGDDDIYSFKRPQAQETPELEEEIALNAAGHITGKTSPNAIIELRDENNIKLYEIESDEAGNFVFKDLIPNQKYVVKISKEGYAENEQIVVSSIDEGRILEIILQKNNPLIQIENGIKRFTTEMILFDFDTYNVRKDAAVELDKIVTAMKDNPDMIIKIESHTDARGSKKYNQYLSNKRAIATRDYIISKGIAARRIESAIGYGEEKPLNHCNGSVACAEKQYAINRRSEFIIVSM